MLHSFVLLVMEADPGEFEHFNEDFPFSEYNRISFRVYVDEPHR